MCFSLVAVSWGYSLVVMHGLIIGLASLVVEQHHSVVVADRFSCSVAEGIFPCTIFLGPQDPFRTCLWISVSGFSLYSLTWLLLGEFLETCIWSPFIQRMDSWLHPWIMSGQWFTHLSSSQLLSPNSSDKALYLSFKEDKRSNSPSEHNTSPLSSNSDVSLSTSWTSDPAPALRKGAD